MSEIVSSGEPVLHSIELLYTNYGKLASSALLWFDFALTFPTEVRHVWRRKFSGAILGCVVIRYTAVIERMLFLSKGFLSNAGFQTCDAIQRADNVMVALNYLAFSAFTILGVYGVWGTNWKPLLVVIPLTLIKPALYIYLSTFYVPLPGGELVAGSCGYHYTTSPVIMLIGRKQGVSGKQIRGTDTSSAPVSQTASATTIAPNIILIVVTWVKTFGIYKTLSRVGMRTPLTTLLIRDGTAYFVILFLSKVAIIISNILPPAPNPGPLRLILIVMWPYFDDILCPIVLWRFLLEACSLNFTDRRAHIGIPGADSSSTISLSSSEMSEIRLNASRIVGNIGTTRHEVSLDAESRVSSHTHVDVSIRAECASPRTDFTDRRGDGDLTGARE